MSNVQISKIGRAVLRNPLLSRAIADAIQSKENVPGKPIIIEFEGQKIIIETWPFCEINAENDTLI